MIRPLIWILAFGCVAIRSQGQSIHSIPAGWIADSKCLVTGASDDEMGSWLRRELVRRRIAICVDEPNEVLVFAAFATLDTQRGTAASWTLHIVPFFLAEDGTYLVIDIGDGGGVHTGPSKEGVRRRVQDSMEIYLDRIADAWHSGR